MVQTNNSHVSIYKRTLWSPDFIQGLETNFSINYKEKVKELEKQVRQMLNINYENGDLSSTLKVLELIDNLERLGLGYRFQTNITQILNKIAEQNDENSWGVEEDEENILVAASLKFRLLRQHGYRFSAQDLCRRFKDSRGVLEGRLQTNTKALLSIYEASYLALEGETELNEAKLFATENLLNKLNNGQENEVVMNEHVKHALDIPLYRMMARLEARWFIDAYSKREDANQLLLELATLDFNMVQSAHKGDLQELSKWWKDIGLTSKLSFIRDRLVECFFASVGIVFEPQYSCCRIGLTKVCSLINSIDDIYDIYGSLDELKVFTNAVKRWEVSELEYCTPEYLQIGFLALYNTVNEMGYETLITHGKNTIPILSKAWGDLAEAFLVEATWTHGNIIPSFEDYLDNAWVSVSGVLILTHGYFLMNQDFKKDTIESLEKCRDLYKWSSMLLRLYNDLAISSDEIEKGGDASAILCYMHQHGVCEEVAREYIKTTLVEEIWRKMMEARIACSEEDVGAPLTDIAISLARISYCIYQYGDGVKAPDEASAKDRILSIIMEPITL